MPLAFHGSGVRQPITDETQAATGVDVWIMIPPTNLPAGLTGIAPGPNKLGWAQSISPNFSRPTTVLRMLDKNRAGRIAAQKPNVESYTVTINAFETYQGPLPARIAGMSSTGSIGANGDQFFMSLQSLGYPIWLVDWSQHPGDTTQEAVYVYGDCWITSWSFSKTIGTPTVAGTVSLTPSWAEYFDAEVLGLPSGPVPVV